LPSRETVTQKAATPTWRRPKRSIRAWINECKADRVELPAVRRCAAPQIPSGSPEGRVNIDRVRLPQQSVPAADAPDRSTGRGRGLGLERRHDDCRAFSRPRTRRDHGVGCNACGVRGQDDSPFAIAIVQRIATPNVEINKLFRLVRDDVLEATAGQQEPFTYGSLPGREDFSSCRSRIGGRAETRLIVSLKMPSLWAATSDTIRFTPTPLR